MTIPEFMQLYKPHSCIVATERAVEIINKRSLLAVLKEYSHKAGSAAEMRVSFLDNLSLAP